MTININGTPVLRGEITLPQRRAWSAFLSCPLLDTTPTAGTSVTITDEGNQLVGTVVERHDLGGSAGLTLVGGAGKLGTVLAAKHYQQPAKLAIAADILQEAGESLDPASTANGNFSAFSRRKGAASVQLNETGLFWRVTREGSVFVGSPLYSASVTGVVRVLGTNTRTGARHASVDDFDFEPGLVYDGERVGAVRYLISAKGLEVFWYAVAN